MLPPMLSEEVPLNGALLGIIRQILYERNDER